MAPFLFAFAMSIISQLGGGMQAFRLTPKLHEVVASTQNSVSSQTKRVYYIDLFTEDRDLPAMPGTSVRLEVTPRQIELGDLKDALDANIEQMGITDFSVDAVFYPERTVTVQHLHHVGCEKEDCGEYKSARIGVRLDMSPDIWGADDFIKEVLGQFGAKELPNEKYQMNVGHYVFTSQTVL